MAKQNVVTREARGADINLKVKVESDTGDIEQSLARVQAALNDIEKGSNLTSFWATQDKQIQRLKNHIDQYNRAVASNKQDEQIRAATNALKNYNALLATGAAEELSRKFNDFPELRKIIEENIRQAVRDADPDFDNLFSVDKFKSAFNLEKNSNLKTFWIDQDKQIQRVRDHIDQYNRAVASDNQLGQRTAATNALRNYNALLATDDISELDRKFSDFQNLRKSIDENIRQFVKASDPDFDDLFSVERFRTTFDSLGALKLDGLDKLAEHIRGKIDDVKKILNDPKLDAMDKLLKLTQFDFGNLESQATYAKQIIDQFPSAQLSKDSRGVAEARSEYIEITKMLTALNSIGNIEFNDLAGLTKIFDNFNKIQSFKSDETAVENVKNLIAELKSLKSQTESTDAAGPVSAGLSDVSHKADEAGSKISELAGQNLSNLASSAEDVAASLQDAANSAQNATNAVNELQAANHQNNQRIKHDKNFTDADRALLNLQSQEEFAAQFPVGFDITNLNKRIIDSNKARIEQYILSEFNKAKNTLGEYSRDSEPIEWINRNGDTYRIDYDGAVYRSVPGVQYDNDENAELLGNLNSFKESQLKKLFKDAVYMRANINGVATDTMQYGLSRILGSVEDDSLYDNMYRAALSKAFGGRLLETDSVYSRQYPDSVKKIYERLLMTQSPESMDDLRDALDREIVAFESKHANDIAENPYYADNNEELSQVLMPIVTDYLKNNNLSMRELYSEIQGRKQSTNNNRAVEQQGDAQKSVTESSKDAANAMNAEAKAKESATSDIYNEIGALKTLQKAKDQASKTDADYLQDLNETQSYLPFDLSANDLWKSANSAMEQFGVYSNEGKQQKALDAAVKAVQYFNAYQAKASESALVSAQQQNPKVFAAMREIEDYAIRSGAENLDLYSVSKFDEIFSSSGKIENAIENRALQYNNTIDSLLYALDNNDIKSFQTKLNNLLQDESFKSDAELFSQVASKGLVDANGNFTSTLAEKVNSINSMINTIKSVGNLDIKNVNDVTDATLALNKARVNTKKYVDVETVAYGDFDSMDLPEYQHKESARQLPDLSYFEQNTKEQRKHQINTSAEKQRVGNLVNSVLNQNREDLSSGYIGSAINIDNELLRPMRLSRLTAAQSGERLSKTKNRFANDVSKLNNKRAIINRDAEWYGIFENGGSFTIGENGWKEWDANGQEVTRDLSKYDTQEKLLSYLQAEILPRASYLRRTKGDEVFDSYIGSYAPYMTTNSNWRQQNQSYINDLSSVISAKFGDQRILNTDNRLRSVITENNQVDTSNSFFKSILDYMGLFNEPASTGQLYDLTNEDIRNGKRASNNETKSIINKLQQRLLKDNSGGNARNADSVTRRNEDLNEQRAREQQWTKSAELDPSLGGSFYFITEDGYELRVDNEGNIAYNKHGGYDEDEEGSAFSGNIATDSAALKKVLSGNIKYARQELSDGTIIDTLSGMLPSYIRIGDRTDQDDSKSAQAARKFLNSYFEYVAQKYDVKGLNDEDLSIRSPFSESGLMTVDDVNKVVPELGRTDYDSVLAAGQQIFDELFTLEGDVFKLPEGNLKDAKAKKEALEQYRDKLNTYYSLRDAVASMSDTYGDMFEENELEYTPPDDIDLDQEIARMQKIIDQYEPEKPKERTRQKNPPKETAENSTQTIENATKSADTAAEQAKQAEQAADEAIAGAEAAMKNADEAAEEAEAAEEKAEDAQKRAADAQNAANVASQETQDANTEISKAQKESNDAAESASKTAESPEPAAQQEDNSAQYNEIANDQQQQQEAIKDAIEETKETTQQLQELQEAKSEQAQQLNESSERSKTQDKTEASGHDATPFDNATPTAASNQEAQTRNIQEQAQARKEAADAIQDANQAVERASQQSTVSVAPPDLPTIGTEAITSQLESINQLKAVIAEISQIQVEPIKLNLIDESSFSDLDETITHLSEDTEKLEEVMDKFNKVFEDTGKSINLDTIQKAAEAMEQLTASVQTQVENYEKVQEALKGFDSSYSTMVDSLKEQLELREKLTKSIEEEQKANKSQLESEKETVSNDIADSGLANNVKVEAEAFQKLNSMVRSHAKAIDRAATSEERKAQVASELSDALADEIAAFELAEENQTPLDTNNLESYAKAMKKFSSAYKTFSQVIADVPDLPDTIMRQFEEFSNRMKAAIESFDTDDGITRIKDYFTNVKAEFEDFNRILREYNALNQDIRAIPAGILRYNQNGPNNQNNQPGPGGPNNPPPDYGDDDFEIEFNHPDGFGQNIASSLRADLDLDDGEIAAIEQRFEEIHGKIQSVRMRRDEVTKELRELIVTAKDEASGETVKYNIRRHVDANGLATYTAATDTTIDFAQQEAYRIKSMQDVYSQLNKTTKEYYDVQRRIEQNNGPHDDALTARRDQLGQSINDLFQQLSGFSDVRGYTELIESYFDTIAAGYAKVEEAQDRAANNQFWNKQEESIKAYKTVVDEINSKPLDETQLHPKTGLNASTKEYKGVLEARKELEKAYAEIADINIADYGKKTGNMLSDDQIERIEKARAATEKYQTVLKKFKDTDAEVIAKNSFDINAEKLGSQLRDYWQKYREGIERSSEQTKQYYDLLERLTKLQQKVALGEEPVAGSQEEFKKLFAEVKKWQNENKAQGLEQLSPMQRLTDIFGDKLIYGALAEVADQARQLGYELVDNIREVDSAMTQLQLVTEASDQEMTQFFTSASGLAQELGQSVVDVLGSIETFSRLGYNLEESTELAKYANVLSNVAGVETEAATTGITSILKGFDLDVSDAEHVADVVTEVGKRYAISSEEIMEAAERSSAAMAASGTSFEKTVALYAAANASVKMCRVT